MQKIKELRNSKNESQTQLAKVVGVSLRTIQNYESGKVDVPSKNLELIAKHYDVSISYLFSDEKIEIKEPIAKYKPEGKIIDKNEYPEKDVYVIPLKGRGGLEQAYFDEVKFKDLETEKLTIKEPSSNGSKWFKIEVEGISMDDGSKKSLSEGDWAYCRSISKQYWKNKLHYHKWNIFCFFHNERGIIFKKIKDQNTETGELLLESLHPDKEQFPDFTIKVSECSYICNVIKVLSEF